MQNPENHHKQERFAAPFTCPGCGQAGSAVWEEQRLPMGAAKGQSQFISVSNGFHRADGVNLTGGPKIVCDQCDTTQPD